MSIKMSNLVKLSPASIQANWRLLDYLNEKQSFGLLKSYDRTLQMPPGVMRVSLQGTTHRSLVRVLLKGIEGAVHPFKVTPTCIADDGSDARLTIQLEPRCSPEEARKRSFKWENA